LLLASIDHARGLSAPADPADQRALASYQSEKADIDDVYDRLTAWMANGYATPSGVVTFYNPVLAPNAEEDSVATMLFNAWVSRVLGGVFDDEGLPGVFRSGGHGRVRALDRFLRGRGAGNALGLGSFNPATSESVFFDVLATPEIENSHEVVLGALVDTLVFLRSAPDADDPFVGGYGTSDMNEWIWGRRHYVTFESLLADFIGGDSSFSAITNQFAINTELLPLKDGGVSESDPLFGLAWFPRQGDNYSVDAGNPGTSGVRFSYNDGPVMRMVIAPDGDDTVGINIIPGGQSALTDSAYFADQARLWLANQTSPMRFSVEQVVEGAAGRETYTP
jgi:hypothetical protein